MTLIPRSSQKWSIHVNLVDSEWQSDRNFSQTMVSQCGICWKHSWISHSSKARRRLSTVGVQEPFKPGTPMLMGHNLVSVSLWVQLHFSLIEGPCFPQSKTMALDGSRVLLLRASATWDKSIQLLLTQTLKSQRMDSGPTGTGWVNLGKSGASPRKQQW